MPDATPSATLLLSPSAPGCGWLPDTSKDIWPRCSEPPAYVLTCAFTGMEAQACIEHTARMRHLHPDWIARVTTATNTPGQEPTANGDAQGVDDSPSSPAVVAQSAPEGSS